MEEEQDALEELRGMQHGWAYRQGAEGTGLQRNLYLILKNLVWVPSLNDLQEAPR